MPQTLSDFALVPDIAGSSASLCFGLFLTFTPSKRLMDSIKYGSTSMSNVEFPLAPFYLMIVISAALYSFAALLILLRRILSASEVGKDSAHNLEVTEL